jgi:hypothetical protein
VIPMKTVRVFIALMIVPFLALAQGFSNLDEAVSGLNRGFEGGDAGAIVAGIGEGDQVMLAFPGLVDESGFFGRDQASYLLANLFKKVEAQKFQQVSARKNSAQGQYNITANWTIGREGKSEERTLYITLTNKNGRWLVVSIRSGTR